MLNTLILLLASLVAAPPLPPVAKCDEECVSCKLRAPSRYTASAVILDGAGSGVAISHGGERYVLTAKHVVDAFRRTRETVVMDRWGVPVEHTRETFVPPIKVRWRDSKGRHKAEWVHLIAESGKDDLAVLSCPQGLATLELLGEDDETEEGEDCWYCGWGNRVPYHLVKSIVNAPSESGCDCRKGRCDDEDCDCGCHDGECSCNPKDWLRVNGEGWFGHSGSGLLVARRHKGKTVMKVAGCVVALRSSCDRHKQPILCETHATIRAFLDSLAGHEDDGGK